MEERHLEALEKREELKKAAQPLIDFLYKYGSPYTAVIVQMEKAELFELELMANFEVRD